MATPTGKIDFRTQTEIEKDKRWDEICARYEDLRRCSNERIAPSRIFVMIAMEKNISSQQIRNICINRGLYVPKTKATV